MRQNDKGRSLPEIIEDFKASQNTNDRYKVLNHPTIDFVLNIDEVKTLLAALTAPQPEASDREILDLIRCQRPGASIGDFMMTDEDALSAIATVRAAGRTD
jgi:hypothetical protein